LRLSTQNFRCQYLSDLELEIVANCHIGICTSSLSTSGVLTTCTFQLLSQVCYEFDGGIDDLGSVTDNHTADLFKIFKNRIWLTALNPASCIPTTTPSYNKGMPNWYTMRTPRLGEQDTYGMAGFNLPSMISELQL